MPTDRGTGNLFGLPRSPGTAIFTIVCVLIAGVGILLPAPAFSVSQPPAASPQAGDPMDPLLVQVVGYYTGTGGQVDDPRAHDLLLEAAADGDTLSQMWLARVYSRGRMLFERDDARARSLAAEVIDDVRRLADANHHEAAFLMGTAYAEGLGVEENQALAMAWYYRAADLDNVLAQHNLGNAYREGTNAPQDLGMAAYWYRRAAEQGDALPCFWLGEFYENGDGVPQDREQALHWYGESARRGNAQGRDALKRLGG